MTIRINAESVTLGVLILTALLVPSVATAIRSAVKWARLESKVEVVINDVKTIIIDKDKTHAVMMEQMKYIWETTDRRLRWLEEHIWSRDESNMG